MIRTLAATALCCVALTARGGPDFDGWTFHQALTRIDELRQTALHGYVPPHLDPSDIDRVAFLLGTDETQRDTLAGLYDAYREQHLRAWVVFAETLDDASRAANNVYTDAYADASNRAFSTLRSVWDSALDAFWSDARLVIDGVPKEVWALVATDRTREEMLRRGVLYRGTYDPVDVLWSLGLSRDTLEPLRDVIETYIEDADALLVRRERAMDALDEAYDVYEAQRQAEVEALDPDIDTSERYRLWQEAGADARQRAADAAERVVDLTQEFDALSARFRERVDARLPPVVIDRVAERVRTTTRTSRREFTEGSTARASVMRVLAISPPGDAAPFHAPEALEGDVRRRVEGLLRDLEAALRVLDDRWDDALRRDEDASSEAGDADRREAWTSVYVSTSRRIYLLVQPIEDRRERAERPPEGLEALRNELEAERRAIDDDFIARLRAMLSVRQRAVIAR